MKITVALMIVKPTLISFENFTSESDG